MKKKEPMAATLSRAMRSLQIDGFHSAQGYG
jgi:hypothetical protein